MMAGLDDLPDLAGEILCRCRQPGQVFILFQPLSHVLVAGRLPAQPDFAIFRMGLFDHLADEGLDGLVAFVEELRQPVGVAVHAEGKLGQVVAADGKTVEATGEGPGLRVMLRKLSEAGSAGPICGSVTLARAAAPFHKGEAVGIGPHRFHMALPKCSSSV